MQELSKGEEACYCQSANGLSITKNRGAHDRSRPFNPRLDNYIFFNCMFYQLLCVQHSCSSTQSWGSVLPSIVETRDQNSRGCPLLFSNRNLRSFCA